MIKLSGRAARTGVVAAALAALVGAFACNSVLGVGDFRPGACDQGATQCVGTTPQTCAAGQWTSLSPCDPGTCKGGQCVAPCTAGDKRCDGNTPEACDTLGHWQKQPSCVDQTCTEGACGGECAAGSKRCTDATPQVCNGGQWDSQISCGAAQHCQGGVCVVNCSSGDVGCQGNAPQACDENGAWQVSDPCLHTTCVLGSCAGVCAPGEGSCGANSTPLACDATGSLKTQTPCAGACVAGSCPGESCDGLPDTCGPAGDENCCPSPLVLGGNYNRSNDGTYPATVSNFRLDRFEATVGRMRKFVEAYPGSKPAVGAGGNPAIANSGWITSWNANLPATAADLKAALRSAADPGDPTLTWTDEVGPNENLPINGASWWISFAFCAWDGGRLPTEAEWNYAAAGGSEQREYPWVDPSSGPKIDGSYAVYYCLGDGSTHDDCSYKDILPVGSRSPKGDGKWGQADLAGSEAEWVFDTYSASYKNPCKDCVSDDETSIRVVRGGSWELEGSFNTTYGRYDFPAEGSGNHIGIRCARTP